VRKEDRGRRAEIAHCRRRRRVVLPCQQRSALLNEPHYRVRPVQDLQRRYWQRAPAAADKTFSVPVFAEPWNG